MKEHGLKHFRVLVADDDSSMLELFQKVLYRVETDRTVHLETGESESKLFYENASSQSLQLFDVVTCQQGNEAVDAVKSSLEEGRPFSVAFIDIRMPPGPDGIWTAEHIRRLDDNVEILIMTGYSDAHPSDITRRVPPVHKLLYFQKPFHIQEIYQFASALSMKWYTERELQRVNKGLEQSVEDRTKKLRESEEKLRNIIEHSDEVFYVHDIEHNLTYVSPASIDLFGYTPEEMMIQWTELITDNPINQRGFEFTEKAIKTGERQEPYLLEVKRKDGNLILIEINESPIKNTEGEVMGITGAVRDVTEMKQSEKVLRESEERFRMIFTNSTDGIIVADPETKKFIYVNPAICKTLGYTEEALTQMGVVDIHPKNSLEHVVSEFEAQARGEKLLAMNLPCLKKDGTIIYMDVNASMVKMGEKHRVMGVFRDITERVKAEETLKKYHNELEHRVKKRTSELNNALKTIQRSEKELTQRKSTLEKLNKELMETNQALSILARNIDRDKELLEKKIYETTSVNIMPIIKELQNDTNCQKRQADLEVMTTYLNDLTSGPTDHHDIIISLTDQEMRVAVMVKNDLTSQKIANMLYISLHTVKTHRKNIRKKLNIQNSTVNLPSYLKSKMVSDSM